MTGPTNAVVGEADEPTNLPTTQITDEMLEEERKLAKFSKTDEYNRLKEYMERRITYYQDFMPDGRDIGAGQPTPEDWRVANRVIAEFKAVLSEYAQAQEVVKEHGQR